MPTIPNQSSVAKAYQEFDDAGRMTPSSCYDRLVDVIEELMKFTLLTRDVGHLFYCRRSVRSNLTLVLNYPLLWENVSHD